MIDKSVRIAQDASRGVHLQVKADWPEAIPKETRVINTPIELSMSWYNAIGYESPRGSFPKHGVDLPRTWIDQVGPEDDSGYLQLGEIGYPDCEQYTW